MTKEQKLRRDLIALTYNSYSGSSAAIEQAKRLEDWIMGRPEQTIFVFTKDTEKKESSDVSAFSPKVKEVISYSREEALRLGNDFIGTEHLLLGLIREGNNKCIKSINELGVNLIKLRKAIEASCGNNKPIDKVNSLPLTKQAESAIKIACLISNAEKNELVHPEYLLYAILRQEDGIAVTVLNSLNISESAIRDKIAEING